MATTGRERFRLDGIRRTGVEIGRGSYTITRKLHFRGLKCVGKEIHSLLYEKAAPRERADMILRFEEECEQLARLHHPNITQFFGIHVTASSRLPALVMEYLPTSLSGCLDKHGILPAEISLGILRDVALGLRYLHEHSPPIIHRDLSASNVLLTTSMSAKIDDVGVAKIVGMNPADAARITQIQGTGTPSYIPPEILAAQPEYTAKVDIFSMGVLTVHVLSGEWPIPKGLIDPDKVALVTEVDRRHDTIVKIEDGHPLLGLIYQCLSNAPSCRPDATEVARQVKEACSQVPPSPENRLELLQQVQSLRAELQQSSRENKKLQAKQSIKIQDNVTLRKEIEGLQAERKQIGSKIESLQAQLSSKTCEWEAVTKQNDSLHSILHVQSLRAESSRDEIEALKAENKALQTEIGRKDFELGSAIASLRAEIETMRSEVASVQDRFRTEAESLRAKIQRLSVHQKAANRKSLAGLDSHTRLEWRKGADAPEKISGEQAVVIGERVFMRWENCEVYQYEWRRDTWSTLPNCPVMQSGMTNYLGKLITIGGRDRHNSFTGKVHQFTDTHQWEEFLSPMPTARSSPAIVTRTSSSSKPPAIAVCGGLDAHWQPTSTVEVYSHMSSQWHTAKPLPIPCYKMTSVMLGDTCYFLGGRDDPASGTKCCFSACLVSNTTSLDSQLLDDLTCTSISDTLLTWSTAACLRGTLIAVGGEDTWTRVTSSAVHRLASDGSWVRVREDLPELRSGTVAVGLPSGELLVAGGFCGSDNSKQTLFVASIVD